MHIVNSDFPIVLIFPSTIIALILYLWFLISLKSSSDLIVKVPVSSSKAPFSSALLILSVDFCSSSVAALTSSIDSSKFSIAPFKDSASLLISFSLEVFSVPCCTACKAFSMAFCCFSSSFMEDLKLFAFCVPAEIFCLISF